MAQYYSILVINWILPILNRAGKSQMLLPTRDTAVRFLRIMQTHLFFYKGRKMEQFHISKNYTSLSAGEEH